MKRLQGVLYLVIVCLVISCKKNYTDPAYQAPTALTIAGPTTVTNTSSIQYGTYYMDNANYNWTVTGDATVSAGQGSSRVTIKFGLQNSTVTVTAKGITNSVNITVQ